MSFLVFSPFGKERNTRPYFCA